MSPTYYGNRELRIGPLYVCWGRHRGGWLQAFDRGLAVSNHDDSRPLFSERYQGQHGVPRKRYVHIGSWCIKTIRPARADHDTRNPATDEEPQP